MGGGGRGEWVITCSMPCFTRYEGTAQPLSLTDLNWHSSGAGIIEPDDRQVTVFSVQPSCHQSECHEALPSSANDEVRCDCTFAEDGNAS